MICSKKTQDATYCAAIKSTFHLRNLKNSYLRMISFPLSFVIGEDGAIITVTKLRKYIRNILTEHIFPRVPAILWFVYRFIC